MTMTRRKLIGKTMTALLYPVVRPLAAAAATGPTPLEMIRPFCYSGAGFRPPLHDIVTGNGWHMATDAATAVRVYDRTAAAADPDHTVERQRLLNVIQGVETRLPWLRDVRQWFTLDPWEPLPERAPCKGCAEAVAHGYDWEGKCEPDCDGTSKLELMAVMDWLPPNMRHYDLARLQHILRALPGVEWGLPGVDVSAGYWNGGQLHPGCPLPFRWAHGDGMVMPLTVNRAARLELFDTVKHLKIRNSEFQISNS